MTLIRMTPRALAAPSRLILGAALAAPAIVHMSAYANTLTAIIPTIFTALDVVSRELVGFIPSATRDATAERAAVGQAVPYPIAPAQSAVDIAPAMAIPEPPDNTWTTDTMVITRAKAVPFGFTGEDQRALNSGGNAGPGYLTIQGQAVAQALRTLTNYIESDLANAMALGASRAWGTAGTTPFGSGDLTDLAQIKKILDDNGAPVSGRSGVLNTSAGAKLITISNLAKVNEAGTDMTLRQGELLDIYGMSLKQSGQAYTQVKGTASGATTSGTALSAGTTTISLASAGTGTIVPGDVITLAGDTNKYVVQTGNANVSAGGSITISKPGLRVAAPASATAITVGNNYTASVAFSSNAAAVVMRAPALPDEGDIAIDRMLITDPRSGVTFEFAVYPGYRKVRIEVALAWGVKCTKQEHTVLLLG